MSVLVNKNYEYKPKQFINYTNYLKEFNSDLYDFYIRLFRLDKKNYMSDSYRIKLVIFGKWFEQYVLQ